jgi:uncharacterized cupin superfamily protein
VSAASDRLVTADALAQPVGAEAEDPLRTTSVELSEVGGVTVGLWSAGPGVDVDVETDEVFVVLEGRGTVTFEDGSVLALQPGAVVRLRAGDRTTWEIAERLRKLYVA